MAENNGSEKIKGWTIGKLGGIFGGSGIVINTVLCFFNKGITPDQMIQFINSWPVVLLGLGAFIAYVIVECYKYASETTQKKITVENYKEETDKLKKRADELETVLNGKKEENYRLGLENGRLEARIHYLEKELERLEKDIDKGGERVSDLNLFNRKRRES